jgi:hypothetical protein
MVLAALGALCPPAIGVIRLPATANLAIVAALIQIPLIRTRFFSAACPCCLPACCQVALDAKDRYRIGGGQIAPRRSYLDQGGTTPLLRAYAIDCPRCSC